MPKTAIEWCDYSWPVLNGCRRKSEGCRNCYAERLAATRLRNTAKYKGLAMYTEGGPRWTGAPRLWLPDLAMPLKLRKPSRIFVADMGDLFFEENSFEDIAAVFGVMAAAPRHTFQVLTKRPERAAEWFAWVAALETHLRAFPRAPKLECAMRAQNLIGQHWTVPNVSEWPLPNVWVGVSVEDQKTADERIPLLLQLPAAVRFASAEPLLGRIDLRAIPANYAVTQGDMLDSLSGCEWYDQDTPYGRARPLEPASNGPRVDQVIVGGESGPGARPFDAEWARALVQQCADAGVAAFVKQLGGNHFAPWKVQWSKQPDGALNAYFIGPDSVVHMDLATVWPNGVWHTWDANGIGGENASEPTVELAKREALAALQRQHIRPIKGWARHPHMLENRKGSDMAEWPEDLRVRQFPEART